MTDTTNQDQTTNEAPAADAAATPPGPTPEQIQAAMKGNQRLVEAGATMVFISGQVNSMVQTLCGGNNRLALAIVSEQKIFFEEVLRQSISINRVPAPGEEAAQDNGQTAEKTSGTDGVDGEEKKA